MSKPDTKADIRNYFKQLGREIYSEQGPTIRRHIDNITGRVRKVTKRIDAEQVEGTPLGKQYVKRHLLGGVNSIAGALDGAAGEKVSKQRRRQRREVSRKSSVVK